MVSFFLVYLFSHFSIHTLLNNFVRQYIVFYQSYVIFRQIAVYIIILALNPNIAQHCLCEMTNFVEKCVILECKTISLIFFRIEISSIGFGPQ